MLFLIAMALKIVITDIKTKKILNHDLTLILVVAIIHHHKFQYKFAALTFAAALIFSKYLGAGDIKLLTLIVLLKPDLHRTLNSLSYILIAAAVLGLSYLIKYRKVRMRIPLAPALCIGLLI